MVSKKRDFKNLPYCYSEFCRVDRGNFAEPPQPLRGGPLEIPGGGGHKFFAARFFFSASCLCRIFFMHLTSARIFFQDYLHFAVCLHDFFL